MTMDLPPNAIATRFISACLFFWTSSLSLYCYGDTPAPEAKAVTQSVLSRFEESRRQTPPLLAEWDLKCFRIFKFAEQEGKGYTLKLAYCRDGNRVETHYTSDSVHWRGVVNGWSIGYTMPYGGGPVFFRPDGKEDGVYTEGIPIFEGYFASSSSTSILEIARHARVVTEHKERPLVDGHPCILLDVVSEDYGTYHVWFDPEAAYFPRKIVVHKEGHNIAWRATRLDEGPGHDKLLPEGSDAVTGRASVDYTMDQAVFDIVDGKPFPVSCRTTHVTNYEDGNVGTVTREYHRTKLDFHPDFKALHAFQPELPNRTRLVNEQDEKVPYQWKDGKPVALNG